MLRWILRYICRNKYRYELILFEDKEDDDKLKDSVFTVIPKDCFYYIISFIDSSKDFFSILLINKTIKRLILNPPSFYFMENIRFTAVGYPIRELLYVTNVCLDWGNDEVGVKSLTKFPTLENLCISHCRASYFYGECFIKLKKLNMKCVQDIIKGAHFKHFGNLEKLNMRYCYQKNIIPSCFQYLEKNLKILNIQNCNQITDDYFKHLKNIKTLVMSGVEKVTDEGISYLENVEVLYMGRCVQITGKTFDRLKKLRTLCMWCSTGFTNFQHLKNLFYLNAENCNQIQDKDLYYLQNIEKILIGGYTKITDKGLSYLKNIQLLGIGCNRYITHEGLNSIHDPRELIFNSCSNVDKEKLRYKSQDYIWINDFRVIKKNFEKKWRLHQTYKRKGCNKKEFKLFS